MNGGEKHIIMPYIAYQTPKRKLLIRQIYIYKATKCWFINSLRQSGAVTKKSNQNEVRDFIKLNSFRCRKRLTDLDASEHMRTTCLF